jgi:hypothetical protein
VAMVDRSADLPAGLRVPLEGHPIRVVYHADVGPLARAGDIARQLHDLEAVVCLGERWGFIVARAASAQELWSQIVREGSAAFTDRALGLGYELRDLRAMEHWLELGEPPWRSRRYPLRDPGAMVAAIADNRVPEKLGSAARVRRVSYENPLEVALTGSGFLIGGVVYALRMIRDWSSARRAAAAEADEAAAIANQAQARAIQAWSEADVLRFFLDEARAGRWHVPPGDLLGTVRSEDLAAANRLAGGDVKLTLPEGLDPSPAET